MPSRAGSFTVESRESRYDDESDAGSFYDMVKIRIKVGPRPAAGPLLN